MIETKENQLLIEDVDMVNISPLPDIKPYMPAFDHRENVSTGRLSANGDQIYKARSDGRFSKKQDVRNIVNQKQKVILFE